MSQAIKKRDSDRLVAGLQHRDINTINEELRDLQQSAHLISPATSIDVLPEGLGIAVSMVHVDVSVNDKGYFLSDDTYSTGAGGKRGLSKTVLNKIAAALGISWDPHASGRVDDGSNPYYCFWRAVGQYRAFDGQVQQIQGTKEMDLRKGSPQLDAMYARYESAKNAREQWKRDKAKDPTDQIREMRLHIVGHAETKAQLRAIRSLGIKTSYTLEELAKPFAVARIHLTGQSSDPELRRMFAEKTAEAFLGSRSSLYGTSPAPAPAPTRVQSGVVGQRLPPPPVGTQPPDIDEDDAIDTQGESAASEAKPAETRSSEPTSSNGFAIPGGKAKGTPLDKAETKDLEYWANRIGRDLDEGNSRNAERDGPLCDAMVAELKRRQGGEEKL